MIVRKGPFLVEWLIANMIGMTLANLLGSSFYGVVTGLKGHLVLGGIIGLAQAVVLARYTRQTRPRTFLWWIAASAAGFLVGAYLGGRLLRLLVPGNRVILQGAVFGLILGTALSLAEWVVLRWFIFKSNAVVWWVPASIAVWVIAEGLSNHFGNALWFMPIFGALVALVTGAVWLWRISPRLAPSPIRLSESH